MAKVHTDRDGNDASNYAARAIMLVRSDYESGLLTEHEHNVLVKYLGEVIIYYKVRKSHPADTHG